METLTLKKEFKLWNEIGEWVCGIYCWRGENRQSILCNGWNKNRDKAEEKAMAEFHKSLNFHKEFERKPETIEERISL